MQYFSLNHQSPSVSFKEATLLGQAPDKGLYFPETIPALDASFIKGIEKYTTEEIAMEVIRPYVKGSLKEVDLLRIVSETVNFSLPLVPISDSISSLELFHGPTLAFKDIGARFMSRCLGEFVKDRSEKVIVLVATSGDTGGAVANGFYDVPGVEVVILYPSGRVSPVQEKQLTAMGKNIKALEVEGSFDDCQQMVKTAFNDAALNKNIFLTSANSINVARWLPQQFYYFLAWKQWNDKENPPVVCVPSGNFGNIGAALLAHASGLPVKHFIAACNANDTIPRYLETALYQPAKAVSTLSNAMDVAAPSNFIRILEIFQQQLPALKNKLSSTSIPDELTLDTIRKVYSKRHYLLDPHGAVGYISLEQYLDTHPQDSGYFVETAHPVKFPEAIRLATGLEVPIPDSLSGLLQQPKKSTVISASYPVLADFLSK